MDNTTLYTDPAKYDFRVRQPLEAYLKDIWRPILLKAITRHITASSVVADLGCGTLEYTQWMGLAKKIFAIDSNTKMLNFGKYKIRSFADNVTILTENALHTSISANTCDIVWSIGLSEYVPLPDLFREVDRITQTKSTVLIQFPNLIHPQNILLTIFYVFFGRLFGKSGKQFRTLHQMDRQAKKYGFARIDIASKGLFCYVPSICYRWKPLATLLLHTWKLADKIWQPFKKTIPLGVNIFCVYVRN